MNYTNENIKALHLVFNDTNISEISNYNNLKYLNIEFIQNKNRNRNRNSKKFSFGDMIISNNRKLKSIKFNNVIRNSNICEYIGIYNNYNLRKIKNIQKNTLYLDFSNNYRLKYLPFLNYLEHIECYNCSIERIPYYNNITTLYIKNIPIKYKFKLYIFKYLYFLEIHTQIYMDNEFLGKYFILSKNQLIFC